MHSAYTLYGALRGYSSLEAWISGGFWSSVQTKQNIFLQYLLQYPFFYHLFIDILRLHKELTEKENSNFRKLWAGKVRGQKKGCPGVYDFNPSGHLKEKSRMNS